MRSEDLCRTQQKKGDKHGARRQANGAAMQCKQGGARCQHLILSKPVLLLDLHAAYNYLCVRCSQHPVGRDTCQARTGAKRHSSGLYEVSEKWFHLTIGAWQENESWCHPPVVWAGLQYMLYINNKGGVSCVSRKRTDMVENPMRRAVLIITYP